MEYEHKGFKIVVTGSGEFEAVINKARVRKSSLLAMKKYIDGLNQFQAFIGVVSVDRWRQSSDGVYKKANIVGIEKPRGKETWSNRKKWIDDTGKTHSEVYAEKDYEALVALEDLRRKHKEIEGELEAKHRAEEEAIEKQLPAIKMPE